MTKRRIHRQIERTPEETERLREIRESFQAERPTLDALVESGEYSEPTSQASYLVTKTIAHLLKEARQQSGMSLAEVSTATGIDRSAVSRLENGLYPNTTVQTLARLASAYNLRLVVGLEREDAEPA